MTKRLNKNQVERKDCKCKCHNDGTIRHTKDDICCKEPDILMASLPCKCGAEESWHVSCSIDPYFTVDKAQIQGIKGHAQLENLKKYTGCVTFGFDPNTKTLDISFRRSLAEWDHGAGFEVSNLTESDKQALREYLESGE